jgi:plasmid replication initiation protein
MPLNEQKLLALILSKLPLEGEYELRNRYKVTLSEYEKVIPSMNRPSVAFTRAVNRLYSRTIRIPMEIENRWIIWETNWICGKGVKEEEGELVYHFSVNVDVWDHAVNTKNNWTSYFCVDARHLKSNYGYRLYQLLRRYRSIGTFTVTFEKICDMFMLSKKYRGNNNGVFTKVIIPAVQDIIQNTNYVLSHEVQKKGKRYHAVTFKFSQKPRQSDEFIDTISCSDIVNRNPSSWNSLNEQQKDIFARPNETDIEASRRYKEMMNGVRKGERF